MTRLRPDRAVVARRRLEAGGGLDVQPDSHDRVLDERYELVALIGSGGMADVWRARDRRLGREVAVKMLAGAGARDPSRRRKIEREARALAAAHHPNIVAVYDYGEASESGVVVPYIVMELVDGPDLHRYVSERGRLDPQEARRILDGVLAGVEHAHAAGVVHGDLKSSNVFVGSHGPKVGDFGVARILDKETGMTTIAATPTFAAPEVLRGERATSASDVYSVACLAFELLTGAPPYSGVTTWEVAQKHMQAEVPSVRSLRPDVPAELESAIHRGMEKDPSRRFASAAAFAAAIDEDEAGIAAPTLPAVADAAAATPGSSSTGTEVLGTPKANAAHVAILGPLAGVWARVQSRYRSVSVPDDRRRWLLAITIALLLLLGFLLLRTPGPSEVTVPDVAGLSPSSAVLKLRTAGFDVSDLSYRPVTDGMGNRVIETIPQAESRVAQGTDVHLVIGVQPPTPAPAPVVREDRNQGEEKDEKKGRGGEGRGRDD